MLKPTKHDPVRLEVMIVVWNNATEIGSDLDVETKIQIKEMI